MSIYRFKVNAVSYFSLIVIALVVFGSCSSSPNLVDIKVHLSDAKQTRLFLCTWDGYSNSVVDSVETNSKGKATFNFHTSTSEILAVTSDKNTFPLMLVVKPGERIKVSGTLINYSIVGSKESSSIKQAQDKLYDYSNEINKLKNLLPDSITSLSDDSVAKDLNIKIDLLKNNARDYGLSYIKGNLYSLSSLFVLTARDDAGNDLFPYGQYRNFYLKLDSCLKNVYPDKPILKSFQNYIYSKEKFYSVDRNAVRIEVGTIIPTVNFNLIDGKIITVPGLWAKLILVDFWANWCSDCQGQPFKLKQVYKDYAKKGLAIIQVAADFNPDSLLSISTRDTLSWMHMAESDPYNSQLYKSLGVIKLPTNFLVDRWGKVIAKNIYGDSLTSILNEILDKQVKVRPVIDSTRLKSERLIPSNISPKITAEPRKTSVVRDTIETN